MPLAPSIPPFSPVWKPIPPDGLLKLLKGKALIPADEIAAIAEELGAGVWELAWSVSSVTEFAVLESLRASLAEIIETGGTVDDWLAMLDDLGWRSPLGEFHERTIFRTTLGSVMEGERYEQLTTNPFVEYLVYDAIDDERVREEHLALDGMTWPRDQFPAGLWPPNGYNCRCSVIPADFEDLDDLDAKLHDGPPPLDQVDEGFRSAPSVLGLSNELNAQLAERIREAGWQVNPRLTPPPREQ
jgi:SPP1 gp7 family putative phage head morphogenesis protein